IAMPLLPRLLLFSACLSSAAQELPMLPDPYESDRKAYDEIYSKGSDVFSAGPNAFMVRTISGRKPGRALDVAMGQGRNALWLASQGWAVTGFDISLSESKSRGRRPKNEDCSLKLSSRPTRILTGAKRNGI